MSSKQQLPRQQPNSSSGSSLIFVNLDFDREENDLLQGLRRHYSGVENVVKLAYQDKDGNLIPAIQIDMESNRSAQNILDQPHFRILNKKYATQTLAKSFVVSKVGSTEKLEQIMQDLSHNYLGIERISQFYDIDLQPVDQIRIDFKSDSTVAKVIKDNFILIDGRRRPIQPYRSLVNVPNEDRPVSEATVTNGSSKPAAKTSQKYLTESRVRELFAQQQMQLEAMINQFENKWNERLSSLPKSSNSNADQLLSTFKDLSTVCQQFNQQNAQIQRQLGVLAHRIQDAQMKLNGEQSHLPIQNGH